MPAVRPQIQPRNVLVAAIAVLAATYAVVAMRLPFSTDTSADISVINSSSNVASSLDVPQSVLDTLQQRLLAVDDVSEWAVLPSQSGRGYSVSLTVDMTGTVDQPTDSWVEQETQDFFRAIYGSGVDVANADIYFLEDQRVVAGAGIGVDAYKKLSITTGTTPADFANLVNSQPVETSDGPGDCWFQTNLSQP